MTPRRLWHPLRVAAVATVLTVVAVLASGCVVVPARPYYARPVYGYRY